MGYLADLAKINIIGSGIAGMSAAALLAKEGHEVIVLEKNSRPGGRINFFDAEGFRFDMGPSWYWMPEVFDNFYKIFGYQSSDFYELVRLDPSYSVYFEDEVVEVPARYENLKKIFEQKDPGSSERLESFMQSAAMKYKVGMEEFVWKPGNSILEFIDRRVISSLFKLQMIGSISKEVKKITKNKSLQHILEFPVLFLGATPQNTPALYSLMNHADLKLGSWYPLGGMYEIAKAFYKIALEQGVQFHFDQEVLALDCKEDKVVSIQTNKASYKGDFIIANADYNHVDQKLLAKKFQSYDHAYWESRDLAPSSLLVFLGIKGKIEGLKHHNLFFDADFEKHTNEIYSTPRWPENPLFYVCNPSKTDSLVAPEGCENLFLLMPIAPGLKDKPSLFKLYLNKFLSRIEKQTGQNLKSRILFKKYFSIDDFNNEYHSFKGNAYGLANTLSQTAFLKPKMKSKKLTNLFFAGQMTTPGPGLPPSIISGQVAAYQILKRL